MVSQGNKVRSHLICDARKKLASNLARPLLEIRGIAQPMRALNDDLDAKSRAHSTHKIFVAIRLITANPMVQMRRRNLQPQPLAKLEQSTGKRNGIRPAGKSDNDRCARSNLDSQERRLDRADQLLFNVASHHVEDYSGLLSASTHMMPERARIHRFALE